MNKPLLVSIGILCAARASDVPHIDTGDGDIGVEVSNMTVFGGTEGTGNDRVGYEQISMWDGIDVVVVAFFVVAAVWLFLSIIYSIILLLLLKLQAQGRLDLDGENFGRLDCCNGFFSLNLGCIARRYAIRMARNDGDSSQHVMTRIERRAALETILHISAISEDVITEEMEPGKDCRDSDSVDGKGALCSICLSGYENDDEAIATKCGHRFHRSCLMDWLERQSNTECPICRESCVTEETIWERVQIMRKGPRKRRGIFQCVNRIIDIMNSRTSHSQIESASSNSMTDEEELSDVEHGSTAD